MKKEGHSWKFKTEGGILFISYTLFDLRVEWEAGTGRVHLTHWALGRSVLSLAPTRGGQDKSGKTLS